MNKAVVTLLIRSLRGGQATIAHYLYVLYYYIIAVTGGGCFERTEISFISFRWRIQRSVAITYPFEEQPDSTRQIHGRSRWYSLQGAFSQEKKVQNQIYLNTNKDRLHNGPRTMDRRFLWAFTRYNHLLWLGGRRCDRPHRYCSEMWERYSLYCWGQLRRHLQNQNISGRKLRYLRIRYPGILKKTAELTVCRWLCPICCFSINEALNTWKRQKIFCTSWKIKANIV